MSSSDLDDNPRLFRPVPLNKIQSIQNHSLLHGFSENTHSLSWHSSSGFHTLDRLSSTCAYNILIRTFLYSLFPPQIRNLLRSLFLPSPNIIFQDLLCQNRVIGLLFFRLIFVVYFRNVFQCRCSAQKLCFAYDIHYV